MSAGLHSLLEVLGENLFPGLIQEAVCPSGSWPISPTFKASSGKGLPLHQSGSPLLPPSSAFTDSSLL